MSSIVSNSMDKPRFCERARRSLLLSASLIVAVQFGMGLMLDGPWRHWRFPKVAEGLRLVRALDQPPTIVGLGSSRLGAAFRDVEMTEQLRQTTAMPNACVVNLGMEAGDFLVSEFVLDRLLADGVKPQTLVLEVAPEFLARDNLWVVSHARRQLRWQDLPGVFHDLQRERHLLRLVTTRLVPCYGFRSELRQAMVRAWSNRACGGSLWGTRNLPSITEVAVHPWRERLVWLGHGREWLKDFHVGGAGQRALERILRRCDTDGIEVILVHVPVSTPRRSLVTPAMAQTFHGYVSRLAWEHHCRFEDWQDRIPDELFADDHHLSREGALEFSHAFAQDVLADHASYREGRVQAYAR